MSQSLLEGSLTGWGMDVNCVKDSAEAVSLLQAAATTDRPFGVVILNEQLLSGLQGTVLARAMKAEPMLRSIPLVVVTSFGQRGDANAAREAGVAAYLTRPIHQSALRQCLVTLFDAAHNPPGETGISPSLITRHSLQEQTHRERPRVLVVDDHELNQVVAVALLERLGCRVDVADSGYAAVAAVQRMPYDLLFMDCHMSDLDGYQATAMIRKWEGGTRRMPIVALTGRALPGDREKCLAAGMDDYFTKPLQYNLLDACLRRWIKHATDTTR